GRRISSAPAIALPAMSISGTKKSPRSNRAPTSSSDGMSASNSMVSGARPAARPALVSSRTTGLLPVSVSSYSPFRLSSWVMPHPLSGWVSEYGRQRLGLDDEQRGHLVDAVVGEPHGGPGDGQRGDHRAVDVAHGGRDG